MANKPSKIKINVMLIDKTALYEAKSGAKYLDCSVWPNKDSEDKFGMTHYIVQEISKERRDAGEKGKIVGNMKLEQPDASRPFAGRPERPPAHEEHERNRAGKTTYPPPEDDPDSDSIPF